MIKDYQFTPGVALVLVGPQGSGKTRRARAISARFERVRWGLGGSLGDHFGLGQLLHDEPDLLIIDEALSADAVRLLLLLAYPTFTTYRKGKGWTEVRRPHVIVCAVPENAHAFRSNTRFDVKEIAQ